MATLVFDIETSALPLEQFDEAQQEYLFREAEKLADETAKTAKRGEITKFMSLWPFTSQVVCIAMLNAETQRGQVLFTAEDFEEEAAEAGPVEFVPCVDETELLTAFWDVTKHYETVVTFNGRGFDVPFIYLRSALLNVPISRKDWLGYRFQTEPHCDLAEQFTFYNVSGREGAARRTARAAPATGLPVCVFQSMGHRSFAKRLDCDRFSGAFVRREDFRTLDHPGAREQRG